MEQLSTRRFFSSDFIIKNKLSFSTVIILQDIYFWLLSDNPPKKLKLNNKTFYFISQSHFTRLNYGLLSQPAVSQIFKELKNIGIIKTSFVKDEKENYINFNWNKIKESLLPDEELQNMEDSPWWKRIHAYADEQIKQESENAETIYDTEYEIVRKGNRDCLVRKQNKENNSNSYNKNRGDKVLLSEEDLGIETKQDEKEKKEKSANPPYSMEAYLIACKIINKSKKENRLYFRHKIKEYNDVSRSDLFDFACNSIQAIYKGNFLNSKHHELSEKFLNNSEFPINLSDVRKILKEVEGDWNKVRKLILNAYDNFEIMRKDDYCPTNKRFLTKVISEWFYGYSDEAGKYQSQFMQCLFEIPKIQKYYSEKKADRIYATMTSEEQKNTQKLYDLAPKGTPAGAFWENVKKMIEWGVNVSHIEMNSKYWFGQSSELPSLFADYCLQNNISVNASTVDIKKAVDCNGPWVWFVKQASQEHNLNLNLCDCVTEQDLLDCYQHQNLSFSDMDEIVF